MISSTYLVVVCTWRLCCKGWVKGSVRGKGGRKGEEMWGKGEAKKQWQTGGVEGGCETGTEQGIKREEERNNIRTHRTASFWRKSWTTAQRNQLHIRANKSRLGQPDLRLHSAGTSLLTHTSQLQDCCTVGRSDNCKLLFFFKTTLRDNIRYLFTAAGRIYGT